MDFAYDARTEELRRRLLDFMTERVHPAEEVAAAQHAAAQRDGADPWRPAPVLAELRAEARSRGL